MAVNKVVRGDGTALIDLTGDTVTSAEHIMAGYIGHLANGTVVTGTGSGGAISIVDESNTKGVTCVITGSELPVIEPLLITANGTYTASGNIGGYSPVTVNVSGSGGSAPSATQHMIVFTFSDSTSTTITAYWDDNFITTAITATVPKTYSGKTVTLAELDGVAWYEPANIPIGVELVDITLVTADHDIDGNTGELKEDQWYGATDFIPISPDMTFSYKSQYWGNNAFYDSSQRFISSFSPYQQGASADDNDPNTAVGTLGGSGITIPQNAAYIRLSTLATPDNTVVSLIRTA